MSKERLEEAKKLIKHYHEQKRSNNVLLTERGVELIEHLYEQAERVQELEEQNKRYREALEFYADENNYREQELKGIVPPMPIKFKPILHDYGSIARQALEGDLE